MTVQIRNLKKSSQDGKEILELQIKKLKENIELKNFEYESLKSQSKSEIEKLRNENGDLRNENKHNAHLK